MKNKRTFITCEVPAELLKEVDFLANKYHLTRSFIIRKALCEFCGWYYYTRVDGSIFENCEEEERGRMTNGNEAHGESCKGYAIS